MAILKVKLGTSDLLEDTRTNSLLGYACNGLVAVCIKQYPYYVRAGDAHSIGTVCDATLLAFNKAGISSPTDQLVVCQDYKATSITGILALIRRVELDTDTGLFTAKGSIG